MKAILLAEVLLLAVCCASCGAATPWLFQPIAEPPEDVTLLAVSSKGSLSNLPLNVRALNIAYLDLSDYVKLKQFTELEYVILGPRYGKPRLTVEAICALGDLPRLRFVDASLGTALSSEMLKAFGKVKQLAGLRLNSAVGQFGDDPEATFDSLAWLLENSPLEELDVQYCKFSGDPAKFLTAARKLKRFAGVRLGGAEQLIDPLLIAELPLRQLFLNCDLSLEVFALLSKNDHLETLELADCNGVTEEGLKKLKACKALRSLSVRGTENLSDSFVAAIAQIDGLRRLDMSAPAMFNEDEGRYEYPALYAVTSACCEFLAKMRDLQVLRLTYCNWLDDAALASLGKAKQLRVLDLEGSTPWTGKGIERLGRCATLEELHLDGEGGFGKSSVNDDVLAAVGALSNLRHLAICLSSKVTAKGLAALSKLKKLEKLAAIECEWANAATLGAIGGLTTLKFLYLHGCKNIDSPAVGQLKGLVNLEQLGLYGCRNVTDHACEVLEALPKLKLVDLRYTGVTTETAKALEDAGKSRGLVVVHY